MAGNSLTAEELEQKLKNPGAAVATNNDLASLWRQAYPEASTAPTNTLAQSQSDVDKMSIRDRLWDSYNFAYGQQRKASDASYDQAYSQMGNQLLSRGMQRSSYGAQAQSNLLNKKAEAQNDIYSSQIAAYENALLNVEQQEQAQKQWQTEFDESVRQFNLLHPETTATGGSTSGGGGSSRSPGTKNPGKNDSTDGTDDSNGTTIDWGPAAQALGTIAGAIKNGLTDTWNTIRSKNNTNTSTKNSVLKPAQKQRLVR